MSGMWSEAEAYANYQGEGRYDDPPAPTAHADVPVIAAAALEEARAALREEREQSPRSCWPGIDRAESVIETLIQAWKGAAA